MFFHIDESGNTGNNLFDPHQPRLGYGVLSANTNVDARGVALHRRMLQKLGVDCLHANQLKVSGLEEISTELRALQDKMQFDFDYYFIEKVDYALVIFFDAVFDAGLNEAVKWEWYWTHLRYPLILNLSLLFDEEQLREAWTLCTHRRIEEETERVVDLLKILKQRAIDSELDARSKEVICDAFDFGIRSPLDLDFGTTNPKLVAPNTVCFQFVVSAIAKRLRQKKRRDAARIVVDHQAQFNGTQIRTHRISQKLSEGMREHPDRHMAVKHPLYADLDPGEEIALGAKAPAKEIDIKRSSESIGLQVADIYLWIFSKILKGESLPYQVSAIVAPIIGRSITDGISLEGLADRWRKFEKRLPTENELTPELRARVEDSIESHREKVKQLNQAQDDQP